MTSFSSILTDYLGQGPASSRPGTLTIASTALGFYYADDTQTLSLWNGTAYVTVSAGQALSAVGSGLTIVSPGTVALDAIPAGDLLGNAGTVAAAPQGIAVGSGLSLSAAGTLTATGASGTVTQIVAGSGLAGGTITTTGTISLTPIAPGDLSGNPGTVAAVPTGIAIGSGLTLSALGTLSATATSGVTSVIIAPSAFLNAGTINSTGTISSPNLAAQSLIGNGATTAAAAGPIAIGAGLSLSSAGTLSAPGGGVITFENGGTAIGTAATLNAGAGLSASIAGGVATIIATGTGGGGSGLTFEQNGTLVATGQTVLNVNGGTVTSTGSVATVTVPSALSQLSDVNESTAPTTGQALTFNGMQWQPSSSLGPSQQVYSGPWKGARLQFTAQKTINSNGAFVTLSWDSAQVDTSGFFNGANPTRLTVPAGVARVRLHCHIFSSSGVATGEYSVRAIKNGILQTQIFGFSTNSGTVTGGHAQYDSQVFDVVAGDFFETQILNAGTAIIIPSTLTAFYNLFQIEVVELTTSTFRPYDIGLFAPGKPGAGVLVDRFVCPRALMLPASATGSQAYAGTAATASAAFSLQHNEATIGSVSFAAGSATGTFSVSSAVTFAPGDRLELVAPATQDATLADAAITISMQF